jgi:predicted unusual protein kinase regulating ubiquinone biosynthesis (AarF/ABC1/UbiB family)
MSCYEILDNIYFLANMGWIFLSESVSYFIFDNYDAFIGNITKRLVKNNVLYVKVFQSLALNNHIINKQMNNQLLKYTDNVPWTQEDICWQTLAILEEKYDLEFDNYVPINSGMISIVFKAHHKNTSEPIIIKMKRNMIQYQLEKGIQHLLFLVKCIDLIPYWRNLGLDKIIQKNVDLLYSQLDFQKEVSNMQKMQTKCEKISYVKIPKVYPEATEQFPNIIMMEFIEGQKMMGVLSEDIVPFAKLYLKFGLTTILIHGLSHADLHYGNVLFRKQDGKHQIVVLDFGIVYEIESHLRNKLLDVFMDFFQDSSEMTSQKLLYSGLLEPMEKINNIPKIHRENIIDIISSLFVKEINEKQQHKIHINIYKTITELKEYVETHQLNLLGIYPSDTLIKIQVALAMNDSIFSCINQHIDYLELVDTVISEIFHLDTLLE